MYLNQGASLISSYPKAEVLSEQAASIEAFNFTTFVAPIVAEKVFKPCAMVYKQMRGVLASY